MNDLSDPSDAFATGQALLVEGAVKAALVPLAAVLAAEPGHEGVRALLVDLAVDSGYTWDAPDFLHTIMDLDVLDAALHVLLAEAHARRGQADAAVAAFRRAIALRPTFTDAHVRLGQTLYENRQLDTALAVFEQAALRDRQAIAPRYFIGLIACEQGDLDHAMGQAHWLWEAHPTYHPGALLKAAIHEKRREMRQAAAIYQGLIGQDAADATVFWRLGKAHLALGAREAALAAFQGATERAPTMAEAHYFIGRILQGDRRTDEALAAYLRAVAARPSFWDAPFCAGRIYEGRQQFDQALVCYEAVLGGTYQTEAAAAALRVAGLQAAIAGSLEGQHHPGIEME